MYIHTYIYIYICNHIYICIYIYKVYITIICLPSLMYSFMAYSISICSVHDCDNTWPLRMYFGCWSWLGLNRCNMHPREVSFHFNRQTNNIYIYIHVCVSICVYDVHIPCTRHSMHVLQGALLSTSCHKMTQPYCGTFW